MFSTSRHQGQRLLSKERCTRLFSTRTRPILHAMRDNSKEESSRRLSSSQRNLLLGLDRLREEGDKRQKRGGATDGPPDFVVIKPAVPQSRPAQEDAATEQEEVDSQDGAKYWREVSGVGDEEEDDEFEEGEEGEEEDEEDLKELNVPQETEEEGKLRELYSTPGKPPPRFVSDKVEIRALQGVGRGLVASSAMDLGALILTSYPLGIVYCEEGSTPENEELGDQLLSETKLSAPQLALLGRLDDGSGKDLTCEAMMITMDILDSSAAATIAASRGGGVPVAVGRVGKFSKESATATSRPVSVSEEQLYAIVNRNAFGEEFLDIATSVMRGEDSLGHIGLWPEAALINHSCSPNATSLTLGNGALMVRATEDIPAGQEITLNWLGQLLTAPLKQRRAELKDKYGFVCECRRCKAESGISGTPLDLKLLTVYDRCQELSPLLDSVIEEGSDPVNLLKIKSELDVHRSSFESLLRETKGISSRLKSWLQASVYDLYDLTSLATDEIGDGQGQKTGRIPDSAMLTAPLLDTERLASCVRTLQWVAKGTDAHCYLSAELMMRTVNKFGDSHQEAVTSIAACKEAFKARYGPVSLEFFEELAAARLNV